MDHRRNIDDEKMLINQTERQDNVRGGHQESVYIDGCSTLNYFSTSNSS